MSVKTIAQSLNVGVIGLGHMGSKIALRLAEDVRIVNVFDRVRTNCSINITLIHACTECQCSDCISFNKPRCD